MRYSKLSLVSFLFLGLPQVAIAQGYVHDWSARFGDSNHQIGEQVATDASGNVIVVGGFAGSANFGGGLLTSLGDYDIFVAKFDSDGNHVWSQRFGDSDYQGASTVAVDAWGNVIVGGRLEGTTNFGGGPLVSTGDWDIFVVKFDTNGAHLWSQRFGDAETQAVMSTAVDALGNIIIVGQAEGTTDFGGGALSSVGDFDIFAAKFNSSGLHIWSHLFGDAVNQQVGQGVGVDASGNVVVAGHFKGTVDFGGGLLASGGADDVFVAKFNAGGSHIWSQRFGGSGGQIGHRVAVDGPGNVILVGYFGGSVDFGGGPLAAVGGSDIFVVKFDSNGAHVWSQHFGDADYQYSADVSLDTSGHVIVAGLLFGTVNFGGGVLASAGDGDVCVAMFDSDGSHLWSDRFGDANGQYAAGLAVDLSKSVIVTGYFYGSVNYGGGPLTSAGVSDIFVAKLVSNATGVGWTPNAGKPQLHSSPNPFNPQALIKYSVSVSGHVTLGVHDVEGRLMDTLVDEVKDPGDYRVTWHGTDGRGKTVSSGVYFLRLESGAESVTRKVILVK